MYFFVNTRTRGGYFLGLFFCGGFAWFLGSQPTAFFKTAKRQGGGRTVFEGGAILLVSWWWRLTMAGIEINWNWKLWLSLQESRGMY
jgi:hypothetical protein